jgi:hypothetical protein
MKERERRDEERLLGDGPGPGDSPEPETQALRDEAQRLLRAGSAAIERALSHDSQEFLRATRQRGGQ